MYFTGKQLQIGISKPYDM